MIRVEYFCTQCNASAQRRDPGDEVNTGYHAETYDKPERARREAPPVPSGWITDASGYMICDACVIEDTRVANRQPPPDNDGWRAAEHEARVREERADWPARATPFGG